MLASARTAQATDAAMMVSQCRSRVEAVAGFPPTPNHKSGLRPGRDMSEQSKTIEQAEFIRRFIARMITMAPFAAFDDGTLVADYAAEVASTYWEDPDQRAEGPEECADADMCYWGE